MKPSTLLLAACCLAQLIVVLDSSILTVALPEIAAELDIAAAYLPWVVNAFAIPIAGLLLLSGKLSDRYGARRVLLVGTIVLAAGSALGGMAPDATTLTCARVSQGVGAALMSPATLSMLSAHFPSGPARARAFGLWGAASGSGGAIGVLAGGLLVEGATWRWALLVNVPLTVGLIALIATLPPTRETAGRGRRLDTAGALAGTVAVTSLTLVFATIESPLLSVGPGAWAAIAVVAMVLFVLIESKWSPEPLIPLRHLEGQNLWVLPAAMFFIGGAMTGAFYFLTLYFQLHQQLTPLGTGLAFLPMSVAAFIASANTHHLSQKISTKGAAMCAVAVMTVALGALAGTTAFGSTSLIMSISVLFGAGMGVAISTVADLVTEAFPAALSGVASGVLTTAQQTGNTIGLAALVALDVSGPSTTHGVAFTGAALMCLIATLLTWRHVRAGSSPRSAQRWADHTS
ncbi:MFS transporter [Arthrobacter sp. UYCu712]|uniref:MFS transporter n=1 Tax=Arthrobacter sp. UYCu712 TaxID=3156340 RepID=UPI0033948D92